MIELCHTDETLAQLGFKSGPEWNPDLVAAIPKGLLHHLNHFKQCHLVAPWPVTLFLDTQNSTVLEHLSRRINAILRVFPVSHPICVCEIPHRDQERCFQFASGHAILFVHTTSLEMPFSGFVHEFMHALGLTGVMEIDEGVATLFEEACEEGAIVWEPALEFDIEWVSHTAMRKVSPANPYAYGATYFAAIISEEGLPALLDSREALRKLTDAASVRDAMAVRLSKMSHEPKVVLTETPDMGMLESLYFSGELEAFMTASVQFFEARDPNGLSPREQTAYGRLLIYLATLEDRRIAETFYLPVVRGEHAVDFCSTGYILSTIAQRMYRVHQSQSRIELKKNSKALLGFLLEHADNSELRVDILLQLIQFHKYVPEIAGGDPDKARSYAEQLSLLPGMEKTASHLLTTLRQYQNDGVVNVTGY